MNGEFANIIMYKAILDTRNNQICNQELDFISQLFMVDTIPSRKFYSALVLSHCINDASAIDFLQTNYKHLYSIFLSSFNLENRKANKTKVSFGDYEDNSAFDSRVRTEYSNPLAGKLDLDNEDLRVWRDFIWCKNIVELLNDDDLWS